MKSAVQLGEKTDKKFLTGIIPDDWTETVHEEERFWSVEVRGKRLSDKKFDELFQTIKNEFGSNLMEVYSITSNGDHFIVYLWKIKH